MASAALLIALSARASGTPTTEGVSAGASPPALCATGAPDCACAAPAGSATARQAASASGRVVLRLTMIDGLLSGSRCGQAERPIGRPCRQARLGPSRFRAPPRALGGAVHPGLGATAVSLAAC